MNQILCVTPTEVYQAVLVVRFLKWLFALIDKATLLH